MMPRLVVQWPTLGPYHLVRLHAAAAVFAASGFEISALETAAADITGRRSVESEGSTPVTTVFPDLTLDALTPAEISAGMADALERIQPDVVAINSYSFPDARACIRWCLKNRRASIVMTDSRREDAHRVPWREWPKKAIVSKFGAAVVAGSPQRRYVRDLGLEDGQIFRAYDVVDNDYFATQSKRFKEEPDATRSLPGLEHEAPFFLASGRMIERKDYPTLLEAYRRYRSTSDVPWRLVILGDGKLRPQLESTIRQKGIAGISLAGWQRYENLPAYCGLAQAFVHTAAVDQWGLVVNEAMASGLPVIVSEGTGCAEDLVMGKGTGFTFPVGDAEELAALMSRMSERLVERQAMSARAREVISHWTPGHFAESLLGASKVALENAGSGSILARTLLGLIQIAARSQTSFHTLKT